MRNDSNHSDCDAGCVNRTVTRDDGLTVVEYCKHRGPPKPTLTRAHAGSPSVLDLVGQALEVREKALAYIRTYWDKDGNENSSDMPDFRAALAATELAAKLLGYLGTGQNMGMEQARAELDRMGWKLEPKGKPKAVGR